MIDNMTEQPEEKLKFHGSVIFAWKEKLHNDDDDDNNNNMRVTDH